MKKIVVITNFMSVAVFHKTVLQALFQDRVEITALAFDRDKIENEIDADVLLISIYPIYLSIKNLVQQRTKIIVLGSTLSEAQFLKVREIPPGSSVLLVNYSPEMAIETLALFRQLGLTDYDFVTYYPGKDTMPNLEIAVTPGEPDAGPRYIKRVMDIGHRTLDVRTIIDITLELGMESLLDEPRFLRHFQSLKSASSSASSLLDRAHINEDRFLKLIDVIDEGIIVVTPEGMVLTMNEKAMNLLGIASSCIGKKITDIMPLGGFSLETAIEGKALVLNGSDFSLKYFPVHSNGKIISALILLNKFEEQERYQHELRSQIIGKGHKAKYFFKDIVAESGIMLKVIDLAKKMSRSDSSILITGESGTGKELFAQAIHNTSLRNSYQFVALNCAAIPETLFESELFGYEEGAFTGAKKGGKAGLFELSHNGTIFLDEIAEMPIQLQSRLLRVIQEKEVMRIGGDRVIPVNVRIIAATNQNLGDLIEKHTFRPDLYYRLNVLSLRLPPLRERKQDIPILIKTVRNSIGARYELSDTVLSYFCNHAWNGNFRELRNIIEYLAYLEKDIIEMEDLPPHFTDKPTESIHSHSTNIEPFIFSCLIRAWNQNRGVGRRRLAEQAREEGFLITEGEIRRHLVRLDQEGLVSSEPGRKGSFLTTKGHAYYQEKFKTKAYI